MRRTLIFSVLLVALGWASGNAGNVWKDELLIDPGPVDTADWVGESDVIDDTIGPFYSPTFSTSHEFTGLYGSVIQTTRAAAADSGLLDTDTAFFFMETKMDHDSDDTWHQVWKSAVVTGPNADNIQIQIDGDSVQSFGDIGRFGVYLIAEEDSMRSNAALNFDTYGDSTTIHWTRKWIMYVIERLR